MSTPGAEPALSSDNSATSLSPEPPDVESKQEMYDVGSNAPVTRLPDEILDWIIKDLKADPNGLRLPFGTGVKRFKNADMLSCSLVCQRWRRIALPYLFHRYRLVDFWGDCHDALEDLSDDEDNIFNFLSEAETITPLIRELIFDSSILPLSSLSCFLTLLPRLQSVGIARTPIVGYDECVDRGETFRIDRVKFFPSSGEDNRLRDYAVNLLELLTIFSEIGTLCLSGVGLSDEDYRGRDEDEDEDVDHSSRIMEAVKRSLVQGLIIRGLHLNQSKYMDIYRAVLCSHPDILMHVVCLELTGVGFEIREYGTITSLLSLLGPKRELTLNFRWLWNDPWFSKGLYYLVSNIKDEILGLLKDPLSACTSLHALRLSMSSSITLSHTQSLEDRNATAVEFAVEDWTLLVRMIDAVRSEKLTHVALCFWQEVDPWSDRKYCSRDSDFHELPWSMLQDACRSHGKLESIAISFAEDARKNDEQVGLQCIREQMKEFKEAIALGESGEFNTCREKTCLWYKP